MILVCGHPGADVRRTVAKHNATTGFVVAQVANGVSIGEHQIREVQHHDGVETHRKNGCVKKFEELRTLPVSCSRRAGDVQISRMRLMSR